MADRAVALMPFNQSSLSAKSSNAFCFRPIGEVFWTCDGPKRLPRTSARFRNWSAFVIGIAGRSKMRSPDGVPAGLPWESIIHRLKPRHGRGWGPGAVAGLSTTQRYKGTIWIWWRCFRCARRPGTWTFADRGRLWTPCDEQATSARRRKGIAAVGLS